MMDKLRLLLVDDDEVDRMAIRRALLAGGLDAEVTEADSVSTSIAALSAGHFDCMLLDYQLAGGSGLDVLASPATRPGRPATVALTGRGDEAVAVQMMKAGAADYLTKNDLAPARLVQSVRNAVRTARAEEEARRLQTERAQLLEREREARRQAESANEAKDRFLAMVSHELRTPLNAILGWARVLRTSQPPLEVGQAHRALETIERNARVQAQLIEDLLDVSRIVSGKLRVEVRSCSLRNVLVAAVEAVRPRAEAAGVTLVEEIEPVPDTTGDPDRLQQVIWNLLNNAIKFTPREGRVTLRLRAADGMAVVEVQDTGRGIHPALLPHVFEPFVQAEVAAHRAHGGLGLGLAIVDHIVRLHGGRVAAASEGDGRGATFTVALPLSEHPTAALERASGTPDPGHSRALVGLDVVVVDDHDDTRELLVSILGAHGANVRACASAQEALRAVAAAQPDIVVTDIEMPVEDGFALIRAIRRDQDAARAALPVVALTGSARIEDRIRTLAEGFQIHLPKPVDPMELVTSVATLVGRASA
jgi:signal transduction histidine kinase